MEPNMLEKSKDVFDHNNVEKENKNIKVCGKFDVYERKKGRKRPQIPVKEKGCDEIPVKRGKLSVCEEIIRKDGEIVEKEENFTEENGESSVKYGEIGETAKIGEVLSKRSDIVYEDDVIEGKIAEGPEEGSREGEKEKEEMSTAKRNPKKDSRGGVVSSKARFNAWNPKFDENGIKIDSTMCHQCQRNDKGRVVRCTKCKTKRYCIPCIENWYPGITEEQIAEACPFCLNNCNCKSCLRMVGPVKEKMRDTFEVGTEEKIQFSRQLLRAILPCLKQINQEQMTEKEIEAKIQGVSISEVDIPVEVCSKEEHVLCNYCSTSIVDFHRSTLCCSTSS